MTRPHATYHQGTLWVRAIFKDGRPPFEGTIPNTLLVVGMKPGFEIIYFGGKRGHRSHTKYISREELLKLEVLGRIGKNGGD